MRSRCDAVVRGILRLRSSIREANRTAPLRMTDVEALRMTDVEALRVTDVEALRMTDLGMMTDVENHG